MIRKNNELNLIFCFLNSSAHPILHEQNIDWDLFLKLIIRHRVWHQILAVTRIQTNFLIPIHSKLNDICHKDTLILLRMVAATVSIADLFAKHHIQYCFLKGITLSVQLYEAINQRPCKDIDIWIDKKNYQKAMSLLESLGYQKVHPIYKLEGFQEKYHLAHKRDIKFYHPQHKVQVELHFRLSYFGVDFFPLSSEISKSIKLFDQEILTLKDDYHLLYLMIHGAAHAWSRLRWLYDIALYINAKKCNLNNVVNLATQLGCDYIVEQALIMVDTHFGVNDPLLESLVKKAGKKSKLLAKSGLNFIDSPDEHFDTNIFSKAYFKYHYYLTKIVPWTRKLQVIKEDWIMIENLFYLVRFPKPLTCLYYVIYPFWFIKRFVFRLFRDVFKMQQRGY